MPHINLDPGLPNGEALRFGPAPGAIPDRVRETRVGTVAELAFNQIRGAEKAKVHHVAAIEVE
jgi:hypothetical protein